MSPGSSRSVTAPTVGGLFFPQARGLGLDQTGLSPTAQRKVVSAGANSASFPQAATDLEQLAGLALDPKQVERHTHRIGQERREQRDAAVAAFARLPLVAKEAAADPDRPCPAVAAVAIDGGRLQIRSPAPAATAGS